MNSSARSDVAVSVIVPFRDAAKHLAALLDSLVVQDSCAPWEVIAADNGSTDESRSVLAAYRDRLPIVVVDAPERANPSYARNIGARAASGSKLLFIDADDEVSPNYVSALASALDHHPLVTSRVDSTALNPAWVRTAHGAAWQSEGVGVFFGFWPAAGVNIGIRRQDYEALGGFPEEFSASEDVAFSWIAQEHGMAIQFVGEAIYRYRYRDTLIGLFKQCANWGRHTALLYKRFGPHGMPGRTIATSAAEWRDVTVGLLWPGIDRRPSFVVRAGFCWGRLHGSVRYRVKYL
jgi:glycosyltransferase involved in cell wall biosynthesis